MGGGIEQEDRLMMFCELYGDPLGSTARRSPWLRPRAYFNFRSAGTNLEAKR